MNPATLTPRALEERLDRLRSLYGKYTVALSQLDKGLFGEMKIIGSEEDLWAGKAAIAAEMELLDQEWTHRLFSPLFEDKSQ